MAGSPKGLIETPQNRGETGPAKDVLSDVLRHIRLSGSLQFCLMSRGAWMTDDKPSMKTLGDSGAADSATTIPFHIVVEGGCWLKIEGRHAELGTGDIVAFPYGTGHQLGSGRDGVMVRPVRDLPPKPWRDIPVLRYGDGDIGVRLLCGYLQCDAMSFGPLRHALPNLIHLKAASADPWLTAAVQQMAREVDEPRSGGASVLERLTEITFIELLRHQMSLAAPTDTGWLAALADPALGRCLALIHNDPTHDWSVEKLAAASALSRSALADRFDAVLGVAPMRYVRAWRLSLARFALRNGNKGVSAIAFEAGYGTEAAFNRAFARAYGLPPAAWRQAARLNA